MRKRKPAIYDGAWHEELPAEWLVALRGKNRDAKLAKRLPVNSHRGKGRRNGAQTVAARKKL